MDNTYIRSSTNDGEGDQECKTRNLLKDVYDPGDWVFSLHAKK